MSDAPTQNGYPPDRLAKCLCDSLYSEGGQRVVALAVSELIDYADHFVICHGLSRPHLKALMRAIDETAARCETRVRHVEGAEGMRWIVYDLDSVIVHIFSEEARSFYGLETLWADAPKEVTES